MTNVIRPTFGRPKAPEPERTPKLVEGYQPVRVYGTAAGHFVGLIQVPNSSEGDVFQVVVGSSAGNEAEGVAVIPASPENEMDAEAIGFAVLRALEIVEGKDAPPGIA